jgi:hypothetical protein
MDFAQPILTRNSAIHIMEITNTSLSTVVSALTSILSTIECLKYECKPSVVVPNIYGLAKNDTSVELGLEYGTMPLVETLDAHQYNVHHKKLDCMFHACEKAVQMFPHNEEETTEEEDDADFIPFNDTRLWCLINIEVRTHRLEDCESVVIDCNRLKGDRWTNMWIYRYVTERIETELIWQTRKSYLELYEGCLTADGHIAKYLFNFYAGWDICTNVKLHDRIWHG